MAIASLLSSPPAAAKTTPNRRQPAQRSPTPPRRRSSRQPRHQRRQPRRLASAPTPRRQPPSTTAPASEEDQAKQAVIEAAEHAWYVFNEAKLDPTNDEKVNAALGGVHGRRATWVNKLLDDYRSQNRRSVTLDDRACVGRRLRRHRPASTSTTGTATRRDVRPELKRHGRDRGQPRRLRSRA